MKKVSIVSIGNELLSGLTVDTNRAYLSAQVTEAGLEVVSGYTIGDNIENIVKALSNACRDAEIILVTGGLGPTDDDLTRKALVDFLGVGLEFKQELLLQLEQKYESLKREMPEINKVQAFLPAGSQAIPNPLGTAPGIAAKYQDKLIFVMPGVPSEMKKMFRDSVLDRLKSFAADGVIIAKRIRCFGTGESNIAQMLGDMMNRGRNPLINCTVSYGIITLHIIARAETEQKAREMIDKDEKRLRTLLGDLVFGQNDQTLPEVIGEKLRKNGKTLAVAESCTGGLISKMITDVPGSSGYFLRGWVTYSNESKIEELGVDGNLIAEYGAVSCQVACAMAKGAREISKADYAISVTGIAGPGGSTAEKPVGLVYLGLADRRGSKVKKFIFSHDREFIRQRTAQTALNILRLNL